MLIDQCFALIIISIWIQSTVAFANRRMDGQLHHVANFANQSAELPCEVDSKTCGKIYFITWSKNVSGEWQRVYSYSADRQKALGQFKDEPHRVTLNDSNMVDSNVAHLVVKSLRVSDEGVYKCDVTYVQGKCPSLRYTKLIILAKPGEPVIRINGRRIEADSGLDERKSDANDLIDASDQLISSSGPTLGPFDEGSTVTLECSTSNGRPIPDVKWWNGSRPLRSKSVRMNREDMLSVVSTTKFVVSRNDVGAKFECQVWSNATDKPLSKWITLDIQVKPVILKVRGPRTPVVSGEMVSLTCAVEGARPAATIVWYNRSKVVTGQPTPSIDLMSDGTYRTWSTLVFIASRYDHNGVFSCQGTNQVLERRNEVPLIEKIILQVLYPPAVSIAPEGRIPVNESGTFSISCIFDANPPNVSDVIWYKDGGLISLDDGKLSISQNKDSVTLIMDRITRNDGGYYSCHFKNAFGSGNSSNSAFVDVWYPASVAIDLHPSIVVENSNSLVILTCSVQEGNPSLLKQVHWFYNGQHFKTSQHSESSQLTISNATRYNAGNYSCRGYNGALRGSPISLHKTLIVHYTPSRANLTATLDGEVASKGIKVVLTCSIQEDLGNPPATSYLWLHRGSPLNGVTQSVYKISSLSVANQGNYSCAAVNAVGRGAFAHLTLKAKGAPKMVESLPESFGSVLNQTLVLTCQMECEPLCPIIWYRNNKTLGLGAVMQTTTKSTDEEGDISSVDMEEAQATGKQSNGHYKIRSSIVREDPASNRLASTKSHLHIYDYSFLRDSDVITCTSQSNGIGSPVSSSSVFKMEYAPENVQVSVRHLEVLEGDELNSEPIVCSGDANPRGHYHWIRGSNGQLITYGAELRFNHTSSRISRQLNDNYTCVVTNKHGIGTAHFTLNVVYRPECRVRRESIGPNKWLLECDAFSNPPVFNFTWIRYNKTLAESPHSKRPPKGRAHKDKSVLIMEESDLDAYSCIAANMVGSSVPCKVKIQEISTPSGWVQLLLRDENLIIVGASFGCLIFVIMSSVVIFLVLVGRRKLKSLGKANSSIHHHSASSDQYSSNTHKTASFNKLPILEERTIPDGRCSDNNSNIGDVSDATLQRSPLITRSHQCITLGPMGSPLLMSEYLSDENDSETQVSASPTSIHHHYESTSPFRAVTNYYAIRHPPTSHYTLPLPPPPPLPPERTHTHRHHRYAHPNHVLYDFNYRRYHHQRIT